VDPILGIPVKLFRPTHTKARITGKVPQLFSAARGRLHLCQEFCFSKGDAYFLPFCLDWAKLSDTTNGQRTPSVTAYAHYQRRLAVLRLDRYLVTVWETGILRAWFAFLLHRSNPKPGVK